MRIILFLFVISLYYSCSNDVTTIGQDLIDNESFVEMVEIKIKNTSTVKLDSFPTSTGETYEPVKKLLVGKVDDPITGITTVIPFFEIVPGGGTAINKDFVYDSVTFNCSYTSDIWGDTTQLQTYHLCQMEQLPTLDKKTDLIYNVASVPYKTEPLGTYQVWPRKQRLQNMWFRLNDDLGRELYNMVRRQTVEITNSLRFIHWFKGVALVPEPGNTCILGLYSAPDSLSIRLHFHDGRGNYSYSFTKSSAYNKYTFMNMVNDAIDTPYEILKNQQDNLLFSDATRPGAKSGQTVTQGVSGYLIKMRLPIHPASEKYRTIIKAEIELVPQQGVSRFFAMPSEVYVYKSDKDNRLISLLTTNDGKALSGKLVDDPTKPNGNKYSINITDFYNALTLEGDASSNSYILISIPYEQMNNSLNRLVIDEIPVLKIYYAKYE